MTNTFLTAYNQDVQRFIRTAESTSISKESIYKAIEEKVFSTGESFSRMFPNRQRQVLDEVVYLTRSTGVWTIGRDKLAERAGCGVRTVASAVKAIKDTGLFLVARLANQRAGKYIFVLKSHPNFQRILKEVFFVEESTEIEDIAHHSAPQIAPLQNPESLVAVRTNSEKQDSNDLNHSSKQERDIICNAIESDLQNAMDDEQEAKHVDDYFISEYQHEVYKYIRSNDDLHDSIQKAAPILGLRTGSNATRYSAVKAIQAIIKIDGFLKREGVARESIAALFDKIYKHGVNMDEYEKNHRKNHPVSEQQNRPKFHFYNWLEIRESN